MRRYGVLALTLVAVVIAAFAVTGDTDAANRRFSAPLEGEQEVNAQGVPNQGDLDGTGFASITLSPGRGQICYEITVEGIEPATLAHIHRAPAGVNGPVVVTFVPPTDGSSEGCVETPASLINEIRANPAGFYFNVHNGPFGGGALRGQLA